MPAKNQPVAEPAAIPERGRRLAADDRRARILEAAKIVFAGRGYAAANVADICTAAGIARGTFYLYFDNKPSILTALLEGVEERVEKVMAARLPLEGGIIRMRKADAPKVLQFCKDRMAELLAAVFADEKTLRLVIREARGAGGVIEETIARIDDVVLAAMERDIQVAQEVGIFRAGNARLMARFVLGGTEKILLLALAKDEAIDTAEIIRETVQLELFGLLSERMR